jgi:hypothetical protein
MQRIARRDFLLAAAALLAASVPRLYGLSDQILLDDEWHGLGWVIPRSGWDVVSSFNPRDNSSPLLNLYAWLLLHTVGWSELGLRLPTLAAGLATAALLPLLVRRDVGDRAARFFAFLLVISPLLVFYSRFWRAYSLFALLGFCSLWALHRWSRSASPRHAVAYVVLSTLAVWFHLWALVVVFAPLATLFALRVVARGRQTRLSPSPRPCAIAAVGLAAAAAIALVLFPALSEGRRLPWGAGRIAPPAVGEALLLLAGTGAPLAALVVGLLSLLGARALWQSQPLLLAMIAGTSAAYGVGLAISQPAGAEWGLTLIRYAIVLVPIAMLLTAVGLDRASARITPRWAAAVVAWGALVTLLAVGPFRTIYGLPNNFTNHRGFQSSYAPVDWDAPAGAVRMHGAALRASEIPAYYRRLSALPHVHAIVEYPFDISDFNNRLYYYQHFHRKRVLAGYQTNERLMGYRLADPGQKVTVGIVVDGLLAGVATERLHFANMVDVTDPNALLASGASHLVLHKWSDTRVFPDGDGAAPVAYRSVPRLRIAYERLWGAPSYEDDEIVVFRIPRDPAAPAGSSSP